MTTPRANTFRNPSRKVSTHLVEAEPGIDEVGGVGLARGARRRRLRLAVRRALVGLALRRAAARVGVGELGLFVFALEACGRSGLADQQLHDVVQAHVVVENGVAVLHL